MQALEDNRARAGKDSGHIKTLVKGLAALDLLRHRGRVRTVELATALSIDKATASRLLATLLHAGYASRQDGRSFILGPKAFSPSQPRQPTLGLKRQIEPVLRRLVAETGESAHIAVLADDQIMYLACEVPDAMLRVDRPPGTLVSLEQTALGRVFLAFDQSLRPVVPGGGVFPAILQRFREQGYADDNEEYCIGVCCVAAPLFDSQGLVVAALGIAGPAARIDRPRLSELGELVTRMAKQFNCGK